MREGVDVVDRETEALGAALLARHDLDVGRVQAEHLGEHGRERLVRSPVLGRHCNADLERVAVATGDLRASCARLGVNVQLDGAIVVHRVQLRMHEGDTVVPAYAGQMPAERYPDVDQHPKFPDIERSIIESWQNEHKFERSVDQRPEDDEFVTRLRNAVRMLGTARSVHAGAHPID